LIIYRLQEAALAAGHPPQDATFHRHSSIYHDNQSATLVVEIWRILSLMLLIEEEILTLSGKCGTEFVEHTKCHAGSERVSSTIPDIRFRRNDDVDIFAAVTMIRLSGP
jgi:hypothetical protein